MSIIRTTLFYAGFLPTLFGCASVAVNNADYEHTAGRQLPSTAQQDLPAYSHPIIGISLADVEVRSQCPVGLGSFFGNELLENTQNHSNGLISSSMMLPVRLHYDVELSCKHDKDRMKDLSDVVAHSILGASVIPNRTSISYAVMAWVELADDKSRLYYDEFQGVDHGEYAGFFIGALVAMQEAYELMASKAATSVARDVILGINRVDVIASNANLSRQERIERAVSFLKIACVYGGRSVRSRSEREVVTVAQTDAATVKEMVVVDVTEREGFDNIVSEIMAHESAEIRRCMSPYVELILSKMLG